MYECVVRDVEKKICNNQVNEKKKETKTKNCFKKKGFPKLINKIMNHDKKKMFIKQ